MGRPKYSLPFGEVTLLEHLVRRLLCVVDKLVIVKAGKQSEIPLKDGDYPALFIIDDLYENMGPLAGICSGLKFLEQQSIEAAFVTAVDAPFLTTKWVNFLFDQLHHDVEIVMPDVGGYQHVLSAVYRTGLHSTADQLLKQQRRRPLFLMDSHQARLVTGDELRQIDPDLVSLENLNTPEEYQAALQKHATNPPIDQTDSN